MNLHATARALGLWLSNLFWLCGRNRFPAPLRRGSVALAWEADRRRSAGDGEANVCVTVSLYSASDFNSSGTI